MRVTVKDATEQGYVLLATEQAYVRLVDEQAVNALEATLGVYRDALLTL
jgi:hypothetical protein